MKNLQSVVLGAILGGLFLIGGALVAYNFDPQIEAGVLHMLGGGSLQFTVQTLPGTNNSLYVTNNLDGVNTVVISTGNRIAQNGTGGFKLAQLTTANLQAANMEEGVVFYNTTLSVPCISTGPAGGAVKISTGTNPGVNGDCH